VDGVAVKQMEGERQHLLLQENAPPDMTGYVLCAVCVFFLANPIFGAVAFILAGKCHCTGAVGPISHSFDASKKISATKITPNGKYPFLFDFWDDRYK